LLAETNSISIDNDVINGAKPLMGAPYHGYERALASVDAPNRP